LGYQAGLSITTGNNNTIIGSLSGAAGLSDTVLIGAGTTERIKVDAGGLCINGSPLTGGVGYTGSAGSGGSTGSPGPVGYTGSAASSTTGFTWSLQGATGVASTYTMMFRAPQTFTVTETATQADSGSDVATIKINGNAIGGATHTVSATPSVITRSTGNVVTATNSISITFANSGAVNPVVAVKGIIG